jgi:hypothetical protein
MASSRKTGVNEHVSTYGGGTREYTALTTWEQATDIDLVTATQSEVLECYDDAASFDDCVSISGAITSSSYFRIVRPASGQGHDGTPNNGFTFSSTATNNGFTIGENYTQVQDIICSVNHSSTLSYTVFQVSVSGTTQAFVGCIAYNSANSGTGSMYGFYSNINRTGYFIDCLAHSIESVGFRLFANPSTGYFYNCTATNCATGFSQTNGTGYAKNCCSSGNTTADWTGTWTQTTCTAEDATPTYVNAAGDDFHLDAADSVCIDQGTDLSADAAYAFDDDIDKVTRTGTWDIGFDEYVAGGPTVYDVYAVDGVSMSDSCIATAALLASVSDGLAMGDADAAVAHLLALISDGAKMGDSAQGLLTALALAADGITTSDEAMVLAHLLASLADGLAAGDSSTRLAHRSAAVADGVSLADVLATTMRLVALVSDGAKLGDATISISKLISALVADGVILSDSASRLLHVLATSPDGILLSDSAASTLLLLALSADGVSLSDSGIVTANFKVDCVDTVQFADALSAVMRLIALVSDGIKLGDRCIETSYLPTGEVKITFTTKQATITFTVKVPSMTATAKGPKVTVN